jgi:hypothetical protein
MANVLSKAELNDHDGTGDEHYCSNQAYCNSMNCVSELVSRHMHLPNRMQPVPRDRVTWIAQLS